MACAEARSASAERSAFWKILRLESCDQLAGCDGIADRHVSFLKTAADPESQIDRILGLDLTRQTDRFVAWRMLDRSHAHWSDFDLLGLLLAACSEGQRDRDDEYNSFHCDIASSPLRRRTCLPVISRPWRRPFLAAASDCPRCANCR